MLKEAGSEGSLITVVSITLPLPFTFPNAPKYKMRNTRQWRDRGHSSLSVPSPPLRPVTLPSSFPLMAPLLKRQNWFQTTQKSIPFCLPSALTAHQGSHGADFLSKSFLHSVSDLFFSRRGLEGLSAQIQTPFSWLRYLRAIAGSLAHTVSYRHILRKLFLGLLY